MKKLLPIIVIATLTLAVIGWQSGIQSASKLPYPDPPTADNPTKCVQTIANEIYLMKSAHNQHFQSVIEQEKATSEVVGEAYESMRTYRCWLDYLCESVLYSSLADPEGMKKNESAGISIGNLLPTMPGCVAGENIEIPTTKLKYMKYCAVEANTIKAHAQATENYNACRDMVLAEFAEPAESDLITGSISSEAIKKIKETSAGMIGIDTALRAKAAKQKSSILADKLTSIVQKTQAMETHMDQLYEYMEKFDQKLTCYIQKCD